MGRMKVIACGYRNWSIDIFNTINNIDEIDLIIIKTPKLILLDVINTIKPDVILFYGWSWIIPNEIINKYTCLCLHPSPLPKYRGGTPIQHQILAHEKTSVVSIFKMTEKLDAGPICFQEEFSLEGDISEIFNRIKEIGIKATLMICEKLKNNELEFIDQPDETWPIYKRLTPEESEIKISDFQKYNAIEIYNKIRMLTDFYPNAYVICKDGKKLRITECHIDD